MRIAAKRLQRQIARRCRQTRDIFAAGGARAVLDRVRATAAERLAPGVATLPVNREDVLAADLSRPFQPAIPHVDPGQDLHINWVTTPPAVGSGGHTTLFRIIRHLESSGYRNRVYFYDVYRGDHRYYEAIVRDYYGFAGPVARVTDGMADAHAVIATGWPTAFPVFNSRCAGKRFYFIQDFEPQFYPAGTLSCLAESTYRMGFVGISVGQCFAQKLRSEYGMEVQP